MRRNLLPALLAALAVGALAAGGSAQTPSLAAAQRQLAQDLALGDASGSGTVKTDTAAQVEHLAILGTAQARALVAAQPKSAEAHNLLGLFLAVAYRAGEGQARLRRGSPDPGEVALGLEELSKAAKLQPKKAEYRLDYAWGLVTSGQLKQAQAELRAIGKQFPNLSPSDRGRMAQLQAQAKGVPAKTPAPEVKQPDSIVWVGFDDALATARKENKRVLVDFYTDWCGWCQKLDREVYPDSRVIALSSQYVFVKVNAEVQVDLAKRYKVTGYPTIVVLDGNAREVRRIVGYKPAAAFVAALQ